MSKEYLLGVNKIELERLRFQHIVWSSITNSFLNRINIRKGWKCLDVGCGPGFVSMDLRKMIGKDGEITALEPSGFFLKYLKLCVREKEWTNFIIKQGTVEETQLKDNYYNLIFVRWVIAFIQNPDFFLQKLVTSLKSGGIIAFQDYAYEGLLLYPNGGAFDNASKIVKKYYKSVGGDPYIGAKLPSMFRKNGLKLIDYRANCLAGNPSSGVYQWADKFFTGHIQKMIDVGVATQKEGNNVLNDWLKHKKDQNSIFFSPIVVDAAGKKIRD